MTDFGPQGGQSNFGNSSAYAAAVQRARQIAAKINPTAAESTGKRELEDAYQPEPKKLAVVDSTLSSSAPVIRPGAGLPVAPGMGYGGEGTSTEEISVPDRIVGLIIGRGGEQITRLQAESGCKIQMERSRGTSERACTLTGNREAIGRAKEMVMNLVATLSRSDNFGGGGGGGGGGPPGGDFHDQGGPPGSFVEIMVPAPKVGLIIGKSGETIKSLQDQSGCKMVVVQDSSTPEHEKPLRISGNPQQVEHAKDLVYQLLADKEGGRRQMDRGDRGGQFGGGPNNFNNDFGGGGGFGGGGPPGGGAPGGGLIEILVPRAAVGVVIGKGGLMIKKIQGETGAKLQFEQGRDEGPGDRKCYLTGDPQQCEQARQRVEELIDSVQVDRRDNDNGGGRDRGGRPPGGPPGGPGGRNDRGGDRRDGGGFDRGGSGRGGGDRWNGGGRERGDRAEITLAVPCNRAGFVIGRGGETIKQINAQSGAHCEIDRKQNNNSQERIFTIRGTPDQIEEAKRLIIEKSGIEEGYGSHHNQMGPPASTAYPNQTGFQAGGGGGPPGGGPAGGGGGGGGGWGGPSPGNYQQWGAGGGAPQPGPDPNAQPQVAVNPTNGQPDYTLQWAEYYRGMGMIREAELIEAQAKNKQVGAGAPAVGPAAGVAQASSAPGGAAAPAGGGAADYSAQWAEYYRSIGKMKEAEAIEAQIKNKVTAAPGAAAPMLGGQPQQPAQYGQYAAGGYQPQQNPSPYYGAPGGPHPGQYNYQGYSGGYGQPSAN